MKLPHADPTGFFSFMQQHVRMLFGEKGKWGHGRYPNGTKKGPGRRRLPPEEQNQPAGHKLYRKAMKSKYGIDWREHAKHV